MNELSVDNLLKCLNFYVVLEELYSNTLHRGKRFGFNHRLGHLRLLKRVPTILEYDIDLWVESCSITKRRLGWPTR